MNWMQENRNKKQYKHIAARENKFIISIAALGIHNNETQHNKGTQHMCDDIFLNILLVDEMNNNLFLCT